MYKDFKEFVIVQLESLYQLRDTNRNTEVQIAAYERILTSIIQREVEEMLGRRRRASSQDDENEIVL